MTNENKEILLKDLCARLPYKPICFKKITNCRPGNSVLFEEDIYSFRTGKPTVPDYGQHDYYETVVLEIKPYLRPMYSMTEEEKKKYYDLCTFSEVGYYEFNELKTEIYYHDTVESIDYLNSIHVDYRGLIKKGLALLALGNMYDKI